VDNQRGSGAGGHGHDHHGHDHGHDNHHARAHDKVAEHQHRQWHEEELKEVETAFIAGFRDAPDKQAFLRLSGVPLGLERAGQTSLKLIEVKLEDTFTIGSASPGFGTRELSYQPLPAALVARATKLRFVYVSVDDLAEKSLAEVWPARDHAD
jgi:hypothetical protein